jgi:hypothetical protein
MAILEADVVAMSERRNGARPRSERTPADDFAERQVLGGLLIAGIKPQLTGKPSSGRKELAEVRSILTETDFRRPSHRELFAVICDLADRGEAVTPATVTAELPAAAREALGNLDLMVADVESYGATATHARRVAELARRFDLGVAATELRDAAVDGDEDRLSKALGDIARTASQSASVSIWGDVAAVMRGEYEPVRPIWLRRSDGACLVYPGQSHWLMGEPGKGKSWVALHLMAEVLNAGEKAVYLDWEGNEALVGERLRALGVSAEVAANSFAYVRPGAYPASTKAAIEARVSEWDAAVVIIDGVAKALTARGANEDSAPEVLRWWDDVITPLTEIGAAVVALDHVTKEREGRGMWARGSGAKLGEVSGAAWMVVPRQNFSRQQGGRIDLKQAKDRIGYNAADGDVVASISFDPTDNGAVLSVKVEAPLSGTTAPEWLPTEMMEQVSLLLEAANVPLSQNRIEKTVTGKATTARRAVKALTEAGHVSMEPGRGGSFMYRLREPYRQPKEGASATP